MITLCAKVVNYYEKYPEDFMNFLDLNNLGYVDILAIYNMMDTRLRKIKELEDVMSYQKQIIESFSIIRKNYDVVIDKSIVEQIMLLENDVIQSNPEKINTLMKEIGVAGYKFQLKYYCKVLDEILSADIWENIFI